MYGLTSFVLPVDTFIFLVLATISHVTGNVLRNESLIELKSDGTRDGSDFRTLSNLKTFLEVTSAGDGKSFGLGKWLESMLSSMMTSAGGIRAVELLHQVGTAIMDRIKSSAGDAVQGRGDSGYGDGGGHGLHSLEGALLSLAFLTFAVFLINFIQQFITLLNTGIRTPLLGIGRRKRRNVQPVPLSVKDAASPRELSTLTSMVFTSIENPAF